MNSEIQHYQQQSTRSRLAYANMLAGAVGMLPEGLNDKATAKPSPAKIMLVLETGAMLGLAPMAAIRGIDVIEGRATITPRLATALIRRAGHKLRFTEEGTIEGGDYKVTATITRKEDPDDVIARSFTPHMAARAGLCQYVETRGVWRTIAEAERSGKPKPWQQYPEDMCQWRALARAMRAGAEDVLMGIDYFTEELGVIVSDDGARLEVRDDEDALIREFRTFTDKQAMREFRQLHGDETAWTRRVDDEFFAHIPSCTIDTGQPAIGAPGNTGDAEVDAMATEAPQQPQGEAESAPPVSADEPDDSEPADLEFSEPVDEAPEPADDPMPGPEAGEAKMQEWIDRQLAREAAEEQGE